MSKRVCPIEAMRLNPACYYCMTKEMSMYYANNIYQSMPGAYDSGYRWRQMMESQSDQEAFMLEQETGPFIKYPLEEETQEGGQVNQMPGMQEPVNINAGPGNNMNQMMEQEKYMAPLKSNFTREEALEIGRRLGIDFHKVAFEQFVMGLKVELEHGRRDPETDVTGDNPILTGKIALAHLNEIPDYYTRLKRMEEEAKIYYAKKGIKLNL